MCKSGGMKKPHRAEELKVQAVTTLRRGISVTEVSKQFSIHRSTLYRWKKRTGNSKKLQQVLKKKPRSGGPRSELRFNPKKYLEACFKPATKAGFESDLWNVKRLKQHLEKSFQIKTSESTLLRSLKELGLSYQKVESRYLQQNPKEVRKWLDQELKEILRFCSKNGAILYFQDESTIQLSPNQGRSWSKIAQTPIVHTTGSRGSIKAISAITKEGRLLFGLQKKTFTAKEVVRFLKRLKAEHPRRYIVVVMDQARPHVGKVMKDYLKTQKKLKVCYLPPYSPESNPDEKLWNHLKNHSLASHKATTVEELKRITFNKLNHLRRHPEIVRGIFNRCHVAQYMT